MIRMLRDALTIGPAFLRLLRSDYVEADDFLAAVDKADADGTRVRKWIASIPALQDIAARPMLPPLPSRDVLLAMPEGTVGRVLGEMLAEQGFEPIRRERPDTDVGRVKTWLDTTHDLWHVVTGFGTHIAGEAGLQMVYLAQADTRISLMVQAAFCLRSIQGDREHILEVLDGVAFGWRLGREADALLGVDWHAELETPLDELRRRLRITPAQGALAEGRYGEEVAMLAA